MNSQSRSVWAVSIALVVIFVGLFLVCAQRRGTVAGGDDLSSNDEEFRQELLQLLDLTEGEGEGEAESLYSNDFALADELQQGSDEESAENADAALTDDELLALLGAENETGDEAAAVGKQEPPPAQRTQLESKPVTTTATMGLTPEMFKKMRADISRLESALERSSATVDSLQNIIANRNARLKELESRKTNSRIVIPVLSKTAQKPARAAAKTAAAGESAFEAAYKSARAKFERRSYQAAIDEFNALLAQYPDHRLADNCQYWIGECYFGMKEYQKAVVEFQKVFSYSETDKHDDAQLMVGLSYVRSNQTELAQKAFCTFLDNYAGSEYTSVAKRYYRNI